MQPGPAIPLNQSHRRAITIALRMMDQMLCEFEEYARGREIHSVFFEERNSLAARQKTALLAEIEQVRGLMEEIKNHLALESEVENVANRIWGSACAFWEVLIETTSRHLKRFGEAPAELAEYLDPRMEALIQHLGAITRIAGSRSGHRTSVAGGPESEAASKEVGDHDAQEGRSAGPEAPSRGGDAPEPGD
jgi:hypothetical protein